MLSTVNATLNRRDFSKALTIGLGASAGPALSIHSRRPIPTRT